MSEASKPQNRLPPEQQAIRDKCFHPSGKFIVFPKEDVETSIPERFEKIARIDPERLAVKMGDRALSCHELNDVRQLLKRLFFIVLKVLAWKLLAFGYGAPTARDLNSAAILQRMGSSFYRSIRRAIRGAANVC